MKEIIKRIITGAFLGISSWYIFMCLPPYVFSTILAGILFYILFFEWPNFFSYRSKTFWMLMPLYPIIPFWLMISMNQHPVDRIVLFIIILIVSTYDTGAYVIGSMFGRTKMAQTISPGKTWEGFFGGYLCATVGFGYYLWSQKSIHGWTSIIIFSLLVCICDCAGDLFESWLKRRAHIKNSGTILPGHGGFLDRFDGILCAVFFFYLYKDCIIKLFYL